jgi:hypothetical protein
MFKGCAALTSIYLSASFPASTNANYFMGASALTTITIDPAHASLSASNGMLLSKDGTRLYSYPSAAGEVTLPGAITTLGFSAFRDTAALTSLTLPGVTTFLSTYTIAVCPLLETVDAPLLSEITASSFYSCAKLATLKVPRITSIEGAVFMSCQADTDLTIFMGAEQPTVSGSPFDTSCNGKNVTVKVPAGAISGTNYNDAWKTTLAGASGINLTVEELDE